MTARWLPQQISPLNFLGYFLQSSGGTIRAWTADTSHVVCSWVRVRIRVCVYGVTELFRYFLSSGGTIRAWTADTSHVVCSWVRVRIRVRVCVYGVTELFRYFLSSGGTIRAWTADTSHVVCSWVRVRITAAPRQKGITNNFVKIELSPLPGPEWQYLSVGIIKHPILDL